MDKRKQTLLNASYFFYGCAVLDIIQFIRSLINGTFKFNAVVDGVSKASADTGVMIVLIILLSLGSIGTIIKLYLAVKGMRQAYGKGKGYGNIVWAKIVAVLLVIGIIGTSVSVYQGTEQWYMLISPVVSLIAAYFYIKSASALRA